jgi:hypothetical protein
MEVEAVVEARQQGMLDPVRDLLGDAAVGIAGKERLRLPSSIGEVRWPAIAAGKLADGRMTRRPVMSLGSSERIRFPSRNLALPFVAVVAGLHQHVRVRRRS